VLLDRIPTDTKDADIFVSQSATGGLGVFVKPSVVINVGDALTEYPGEPRWVKRDEIDRLKGIKGQYSFHAGPFHMGQEDEMWILWSAYERRRSGFDGPKAHWINSSHPCLDNFWSRPNCVFGLYVKNVDKSGLSHLPDVRLFVLCSEGILGDGEKELLIDYHWHVTELFGVICGDYSCKLCFESMQIFMTNWERKLGRQSHIS